MKRIKDRLEKASLSFRRISNFNVIWLGCLLNINLYACHDSGFGHGESLHCLVFLRQQIFAARISGYVFEYFVARSKIPKREIFLVGVFACGEIQPGNVLHTRRCAEFTVNIVCTHIKFVFRRARSGIAHVKIAVVGVE